MMEFGTRWLITIVTGGGQMLLGLSLLSPPALGTVVYIEGLIPVLKPDRLAVVFIVTGLLMLGRLLVPMRLIPYHDILFSLLSLPLLLLGLWSASGWLAGAVVMGEAVAFGIIYALLMVVYIRLNGGAHGT